MIYFIIDVNTNSLIEACGNEQEADKIVEEYQKKHRNVTKIIGGWN